jgi:hypothetical protein
MEHVHLLGRGRRGALSRERFFLELTPNPDFDRFPFGVELDPDTKTRS